MMALVWCACLPANAAAADDLRQSAEQVDFRRDVYPILRDRCFDCHSGRDATSGYRLDVRDELLGRLNGSAAVEIGRSGRSRLIERVTTDDEAERMPQDGEPLPSAEIDVLRRWIDQGLAWDGQALPHDASASDHWSFRPIRRPPLPTLADHAWVRTPVDAFIAAEHQRRELSHARAATRRELARRLSLDVIGLPPTVEELDAFLADRAAGSYERLVERLLSSPHYGERSGRLWLDVARWGESDGYQHDVPRPYAWRYRDYVIDSFNDDKPYDRFLLEQLAGDEIEPLADEHLVATGFLAAARISGNQLDKAIQRNDILVDITNATATAVLGLTMECAQCHNHKFDPLTQRDYYRLQGFFVRGQIVNLELTDPAATHAGPIERLMPKSGLTRYVNDSAQFGDRLTKARPFTWAYYSPATGHAELEVLPTVQQWPLPYDATFLETATPRILVRGDALAPGPEVEPGWPEVFGATASPQIEAQPRTALAKWLAARDNPLVARVWVNRLWEAHFGRGLVATSNDFGTQGARPTHPELLDWLASELIDSGFRTKHIHRLILLSSTYRQSVRGDPTNSTIDPNNDLLWRFPTRRLDSEGIRDSILAATGELNRLVGGPSVLPDEEDMLHRRSMYAFQKRNHLPEMQAMFDGPSTTTSCSRRAVSTVATQPLFLLNSQFMAERSHALVKRAMSRADAADTPSFVRAAFATALLRQPDDEELALASVFVNQAGGPIEARVASLCLVLLNLNEFVYTP